MIRAAAKQRVEAARADQCFESFVPSSNSIVDVTLQSVPDLPIWPMHKSEYCLHARSCWERGGANPLCPDVRDLVPLARGSQHSPQNSRTECSSGRPVRQIVLASSSVSTEPAFPCDCGWPALLDPAALVMLIGRSRAPWVATTAFSWYSNNTFRIIGTFLPFSPSVRRIASSIAWLASL